MVLLIGPRATFADGDPFLAGGGAVDLVDLDEVAWTDPPDREGAGSPNVLGAVALHAAIDDIARLVAAVADIASGRAAPVAYRQDPATGDYHLADSTPVAGGHRALGASCSRG